MAGTWLVVLAAVAIVCGFMVRRRVRRVVKGEEPVVTDEVLRTVLGEGPWSTSRKPMSLWTRIRSGRRKTNSGVPSGTIRSRGVADPWSAPEFPRAILQGFQP